MRELVTPVEARATSCLGLEQPVAASKLRQNDDSTWVCMVNKTTPIFRTLPIVFVLFPVFSAPAATRSSESDPVSAAPGQIQGGKGTKFVAFPKHDTWDCHICRSVGVVLGVNVGKYMLVPWSVWDL